MLLSLLYFIEQLLTHVLNLNVEGFCRERVETESRPTRVLLFPLVLHALLGFAHHSLVDTPLLRVHQLLVGLLQEVEGVRSFFMPTFIRVNQNG